MNLRSTTYPLIDASVIAQAYAMRREASTPTLVRQEPLFSPGWAYGSVIRDRDNLWRMWYWGPPTYCEYYATSPDGLSWNRPDLGELVDSSLDVAGPNAFMSVNQKDAHGHWLVGSMGPEGFSVIDAQVQDHPAAEARFTAMYLAAFQGYEDQRDGLCIAHSDDGVHWRYDERNPIVPGWMDTSNQLLYDERLGKYVIYGRPPTCIGNKALHTVTGSKKHNRVIARTESVDLYRWPPYRTVLDTDEADAPAVGFDEHGTSSQIRPWAGRARQFYGGTVFPYANIYLGLMTMYDLPSGDTWIELCHSHDGIHWKREAGRPPFIGPRPDTWEGSQVRPVVATPPIPVEDEHWIYYSASPHSHGSGRSRTTQWERYMTVRALRHDRWVGYRTEAHEGELLTHAVEAGGGCLTLNASTETDGWLRVSVLHPQREGFEIEGYTFEDSHPITGDALHHPVRWRAQDRLPNGNIRLRIYGQHASIYAFTIEP